MNYLKVCTALCFFFIDTGLLSWFAELLLCSSRWYVCMCVCVCVCVCVCMCVCVSVYALEVIVRLFYWKMLFFPFFNRRGEIQFPTSHHLSALLSAVPVTLKSRDRAFYPFQRISLLFCCSRKRQWNAVLEGSCVLGELEKDCCTTVPFCGQRFFSLSLGRDDPYIQ